MDTAMIGTTVAALLSLMVMSYIYKYNKFYEFASNTFAGAAFGITTITGVSIILNTGILPAMNGNFGGIPGLILGVLVFTRLSKEWSHFSSWPLALVLGTASGFALGGMVNSQVLQQFLAIGRAKILGVGLADALGGICLVVFGICATLFFTFTVKDNEALRTLRNIGKYGIMLAFGGSFGMEVAGRVALLASRVTLIVRTWLMGLLGLL
jgi:hypothetical protein